MSTLLYLAGIFATFVVGMAAGVFFARRGEAERLDLALMLRSIGEAQRCPDHVKVPRKPPRRPAPALADALADAYDVEPATDAWTLDEQACDEAAQVLGIDVHDYQPRRDT